MKKRYRILFWLMLALVLAAVLTVLLARDWPRRQVQSALARALDAEVDLGRLEIRDSRTVILHRLAVYHPRDYPWFESLEVERLTVTGTPREILDNRFKSMVLDGAVATVRESAAQMPAREKGSGVDVGRIVVAGGRLIVRSGEGESRFELAGEITGLGRRLGGEVRLRSRRLYLIPLLSFIAGAETINRFSDDTPLDLRHPVDDVVIDVHLDQDDTSAVIDAAAGGSVRFRDADREPLAFPSLGLLINEAPDGGWTWTAEARSPGLVDLLIEGRMTTDGGNPEAENVALVTDEPALLLFSMGLLPEGIAARGRVELAFERTAGAIPDCRVSARVDHLTLPRDVSNTGAASETRELDSLCPLDLAYEGTLEVDENSGDWLTAGRALLTSSTAGELRADGSLLLGGGSANMLEADWAWHGPAITALRRLATAGFGVELSKRYRIEGLPRAAGRASGPLKQPLVSGKLDVDGVDFCLESGNQPSCPLELNGGALTADFRFQQGHGLRFPGVRFSGDVRTGPLEWLPLSLSAAGRINPSTMAGRFEDLSATLGQLARTTGEGRWDPEGNLLLSASIRLEQANLQAIRRALVPLTGELLPGYECEAAVGGGFEATYSAAGVWAIDGVVEMGETWFASEDGARAVQGLASNWQVTAAAGPDGALRAEASTTAGGFQLLWGSVFGDYQELQPQVSLAAGVEGREGRDGHWWAEGNLQPVPGVRVRGSLSGGEGEERRFSAGVRVDDLAAAFERCARRPLGDSWPLLERLDAGGAIHGFAEGRLDGDGVALSGRVLLRGLDLTGADRTIAVQGLELDLPLDLAFGPAAEDGSRAVDGAARRGRMGFDELRMDTLTLQGTRTGLVVQGDTVSLEASQSIPLLGGTITLHRMTLASLLGSRRHAEAGLALDGLQLAELSRALDWPLFEGEVDGHLPRVELSPTRLRVDGGGEISLFGGTVSISDISGEEILSRYPRLSFSAEFREIDLACFTRTFDFGEVTGILEGTVSDCRLFAGTPVGFRAEMRTVPRAGVSQTINVKAINNIAIIGTGGRVTIFDRGIHSLLDRYTYEQLGVKMRLERDMFYLRGTEQRGDRELFLKGRLPFRIDVVNAEPGKTVSFSTMLARLQALDFSQAVTEPGGGDSNVR